MTPQKMSPNSKTPGNRPEEELPRNSALLATLMPAIMDGRLTENLIPKPPVRNGIGFVPECWGEEPTTGEGFRCGLDPKTFKEKVSTGWEKTGPLPMMK